MKTEFLLYLADVLITNLKHPIYQLSEIKEEENVLATDKTTQSR